MRVFISYAHADARLARRLAESLERRGVDAWLDEKRVRVGDSIPSRISQGLESSDYICLLLSEASKSRPWVEREYEAALSLQLNTPTRKPKILPVRLDHSEPPTLLHGVLAADLSTDFDVGLHAILSAMDIPAEPAPFTSLPDALNTDAQHGAAALEAAVRDQDMEALTRLWYAVLAATRQLQEELRRSPNLAARRYVPATAVDGLLAHEPDAVALVPLPQVLMVGELSIRPSQIGKPLYAVRVEGLVELLRALSMWPKQIASRRLLLVPSGVTWSSAMTDEADGSIMFF